MGDPGPGLDALWDSVRPGRQTFQPDRLAGLPGPAQRYLANAIAPEADPNEHGLGWTPVLLRPPLHSYMIPGALLVVAVGGIMVTCAAGLVHRRPWSADASLLPGVILIGWIIVRRAPVTARSFLQSLPLTVGLVPVGFAWALRRAPPAR
jgi:hypothetical protein